MSKFRLIEGSNVVELKPKTTELDLLVNEAQKQDPTDQELFVLAYKFVQAGHLMYAQKQLGRLASGYFDIMIYRDLFKSMYARSMIRAHSDQDPIRVQAEFYMIVERCTSLFEPLTFPEKPAFYRFRNEFKRITRNFT